MPERLLHMTEAQRVYAVDLLHAVLDRLGTSLTDPPARSANWSRLTVHGLADRRAGASVTLSRGTVLLRTPPSPRRGRFAAELAGPACRSLDAVADGGVAAMLVTLAGWHAALSSPVTAATTAEVEETESAVIRLLRGAAHSHRPDWELATLQSSRAEGHVLRVCSREPGGGQLGRSFASRSTTGGGSGMTRELVAEIDRIVGGRAHAHVVELERWKRYRLSLDATPSYCVSPARDPMTTMRALNALPVGARLLPGT